MKKHIALLLALVITAGILAACAAGVPTGSSSYAPSSSSVASAPSSSVAVSSLLQSSSVSTSPTLPIPEENTYTLLSQDDEFSTYRYTVGSRYSNVGVCSFGITIPLNWYFYETTNQYVRNDTQNLIALWISEVGEFMSADELESILPEEDWEQYHTLLDKGQYTCEDGKLVSFLYIKSMYEGLWYAYDYSIMLEEYKALRLIFYYAEYNPDVDLPIQNAIIESIKIY